MRSRFFLVIMMIMFYTASCGEKVLDVSSVDEIPGTWRWRSTCGGEGDNDYTCINASESEYATIEFRSDGTYIEKHMDTLYLQTKYTILKIDDFFATLTLENPPVNRPVTVINNKLMIQRGTFEDTYEKIRKD